MAYTLTRFDRFAVIAFSVRKLPHNRKDERLSDDVHALELLSGRDGHERKLRVGEQGMEGEEE